MKFSEFKYWFLYKSTNCWEIINSNKEPLGKITSSGSILFYDANHNMFDDSDIDIFWKEYKYNFGRCFK